LAARAPLQELQFLLKISFKNPSFFEIIFKLPLAIGEKVEHFSAIIACY
jgi:hypothetical protein